MASKSPEEVLIRWGYHKATGFHSEPRWSMFRYSPMTTRRTGSGYFPLDKAVIIDIVARDEGVYWELRRYYADGWKTSTDRWGNTKWVFRPDKSKKKAAMAATELIAPRLEGM